MEKRCEMTMEDVEDEETLDAGTALARESLEPLEPPAGLPPKIEVLEFLEKIHEQLKKAPGALSPDETVKIELAPHEIGYFYTMMKRLKSAEERAQRAYHKRFPSLDALMEQERARDPQTHPKPFFTEPAANDNPEAALEQKGVQEAFQALPKEIREMASALAEADGNVSELARRMGQPQRKMARKIEKMKTLLREKGLGI